MQFRTVHYNACSEPGQFQLYRQLQDRCSLLMFASLKVPVGFCSAGCLIIMCYEEAIVSR